MKRRDHCSEQPTAHQCRPVRRIEPVQQYPADGPLAKNLGLPLPVLAARLGSVGAKARSYVVRSVRWDPETGAFEQRGSAPNFQGDVLTLCTCKHQMRASRRAADWSGLWVAGFTSRTIHDDRHWLFYLARIEAAYESHAELWAALPAGARRGKGAHRHYLGDVFQPKAPRPAGAARFSPGRYVAPSLHSHRWRDEAGWHDGWHNDVAYRHADVSGHPPLLAADPRRTFLWPEPVIYLPGKHCRNYLTWTSMKDLFAALRGAGA
jgi:hypothetical protein